MKPSRWGDLDEEALGSRRRDDDVALPVVAAGGLQRLGDDQVLAHRFGRAAGLRDDVEAGLAQVDHVHQRRHALGVDVVLDVELRRAALFGGQFVVVQVIERRLHRRRAERAAADAEHDERIEFLADLRGGRFDVGDDFLLIVGQIIQPCMSLPRPASTAACARFSSGTSASRSARAMPRGPTYSAIMD